MAYKRLPNSGLGCSSEHLFGRCEALGLIPNTTNQKKKKEKRKTPNSDSVSLPKKQDIEFLKMPMSNVIFLRNIVRTQMQQFTTSKDERV
jgi:hypothetical protein